MPSVLYGNLSDRPQKANVKLSNNMLLGGKKIAILQKDALSSCIVQRFTFDNLDSRPQKADCHSDLN